MTKFLRIRAVVERSGLSRASIYRDQTFPKPVKIGPRAVAWVEQEIEDWLAARMAERTGE